MFRQVLLSSLGQALRERIAKGAQPREPLAYLRRLRANFLADVERDRLADGLKEVTRELRISLGDRRRQLAVAGSLRLRHAGAV
jgi:hypothetical protein